MSIVRFSCPRCHTSFPVVLQDNQFSCPECSGQYQFTRTGDHDLGWISAPQGRVWETTVIQPIDRHFTFVSEPSPGQADNLGAARTRKLMRQSRRSGRKQAAVFVLALALASLFLLGSNLVPAIAGNISSEHLQTSVANQIMAPIIPSPAPLNSTPFPAATATATSAPTRTPTPLPRNLLIATAWQATLDQAIVQSYATETRNANQYQATETALPPILTMMAIERSEVGTATAEAKHSSP